MTMKRALRLVAAKANPESMNPDGLKEFTKRIDDRWIGEALRVTGTATVRKRKLSVSQVVWLVIGIALFRNRSIAEVASKLDLVLPTKNGKTSIASSSLAEGRSRLGEEGIERLFHRIGWEWARTSASRNQWNGLSLYGIDGSSLNVADTLENRNEFGLHSGSNGESGYPLARLVCLMALVSHVTLAAKIGPYKGCSETALAKQLVEDIPDNSLAILDKNFVYGPFLVPLHRDGINRHWLTRAKTTTKWKILKEIGPGDQIVQLNVGTQSIKADSSLPKTFPARAIRYQRKGFRPGYLLTSLLDPEKYPADEIRELYHVRWEIEMGYDEIKTEMLEREETIRSRTPVNVRQEIWGLLIAFNIVRKEIEEVALESNRSPTRISFIVALQMIRDEFLWLGITSPGAIPKRLAELRADLARYVLPPRRSERAYPRAVKVRCSRYPRKPRNNK